MAAGRKGTAPYSCCCVFVLLECNQTPFSPPQPPQVSLKGQTISLKRQRQGQRGPRPRQAPLQRQTALRPILTCQSWLISFSFTCQPKAFIKFVPFQIHLCMNFFFLMMYTSIKHLKSSTRLSQHVYSSCLFVQQKNEKCYYFNCIRCLEGEVLCSLQKFQFSRSSCSSSCPLEMKRMLC